jgi:hypothetical protein
VGGAVPSGTMLYDFVPLRIEPIEPTMALIEQGLETPHLYRVAVQANAYAPRENDEIEVNMPVGSWYYGYRFRLISVQHASLGPTDPRRQTVVIMRRMDIAHGNQISG